MKKISLSIIAFLFISLASQAQFYDIACDNMIYQDNIKTLNIAKDGFENAEAIIELNSDQKLLLSFDDIDAGVKNYMYSIIHCDADWNPTDAMQNDYIDGYYEDYIVNNSSSLNTLQAYTNYQLEFPSAEMQLTKSGNYLIIVYQDYDTDNIDFTLRFRVLDNQVNIEGNIVRPSLSEHRDYYQQVDFKIDASSVNISDYYRNTRTFVQQNFRLDNILELKPLMIVGGVLDFNYDLENDFSGGNEYRFFDTRPLDYNTQNVKEIKQTLSQYHIILKDEQKRSFTKYYGYEDMNGKYVISSNMNTNTATESEYTYVHFFVESKAPAVEGDIYIMGQFNNWVFNEDNKMEYNFTLKAYEKVLLLKQGYYNYQYVFKGDEETKGDQTYYEGSHFETENQYTIYFYHRENGSSFDELIGLQYIQR